MIDLNLNDWSDCDEHKFMQRKSFIRERIERDEAEEEMRHLEFLEYVNSPMFERDTLSNWI